MVIYWSCLSPSETHRSFSALWEEPTPLLAHLKQEYGNVVKETPGINFLRCPAVLNEIKNIFVVKSPIDYSFVWNGEGVWSKDYNEIFFNDMIEVNNVKRGFACLKFFPIFFAEKNLDITLLPPYMSQSSFASNTMQSSGTFDCSNWLRNLDVQFKFKEKDTPVFLKRGDPVLYIKFHTKENIRFKKFYATPEIEEIVGTGVQVRRFANISKIEYLYDIFKKSKRRSRILKLIKDNLETD